MREQTYSYRDAGYVIFHAAATDKSVSPKSSWLDSAKAGRIISLKASFKGGMSLGKGTLEIMLRGNSRASECLAKNIATLILAHG
jgi:hypothetical protein